MTNYSSQLDCKWDELIYQGLESAFDSQLDEGLEELLGDRLSLFKIGKLTHYQLTPSWELPFTVFPASL